MHFHPCRVKSTLQLKRTRAFPTPHLRTASVRNGQLLNTHTVLASRIQQHIISKRHPCLSMARRSKRRPTRMLQLRPTNRRIRHKRRHTSQHKYRRRASSKISRSPVRQATKYLQARKAMFRTRSTTWLRCRRQSTNRLTQLCQLRPSLLRITRLVSNPTHSHNRRQCSIETIHREATRSTTTHKASRSML